MRDKTTDADRRRRETRRPTHAFETLDVNRRRQTQDARETDARRRETRRPTRDARQDDRRETRDKTTDARRTQTHKLSQTPHILSTINLEFPPGKAPLNFPKEFKINDENPSKSIKELIGDFKSEGYFITFTKHFNLLILLKTEKPEPIELESEEPETIENLENQIMKFFLPDCVKRRMEEIAYESITKQQRESEKE